MNVAAATPIITRQSNLLEKTITRLRAWLDSAPQHIHVEPRHAQCIGNLARRTGLSVSRIRFYEARGLLPAARRADNGYRIYDEDAATLLHFVDQAQRLGFSLAEIKAGLPDQGTTTPSPTKIVAALRQKEVEIDQLIAVAGAKKKRLLRCLRNCGASVERLGALICAACFWF